MQDWTKAHLQYGLALSNLGRYAEAEGIMRGVIGETTRVLGAESYLTGLAWNHLSAVDQAEGHWSEAIEAEAHSYPIMQKYQGDRGLATLSAEATLGSLECLAGNTAAALTMLERVQPVLANVLGPDAPITQITDFYLAAVLNQVGEPQRAWSLVSGLTTTALAAADASDHWEERLQGLKGQILMRLGQEASGRALVGAAVAGLVQNRAPAWIVTPLRQTRAALRAGVP